MPLADDDDLASAQRILLYGVTGSGKSTAAARLGEATGLPVTLVDELTWLPGWVAVDDDEQRRLIGAVTSTDRWILDSAYNQWRDLVHDRVDLVVALDYPRWLSLSRLVRRTISGAITKAPRCNGNTESLRNVVGRGSIVRWHFQSFARKRERMRRWAAEAVGPPVLLLPSPRALDARIEQFRPR